MIGLEVIKQRMAIEFVAEEVVDCLYYGQEKSYPRVIVEIAINVAVDST